MRTFYRILTALLFVLTATCPTRVSAQYAIEKELGSKALGLFQFSEPRSVVSNSDGYFYVGDQTSVYKMSATGEVVTQWKHPYQFIQDLALDHDQNIIVATNNRVYRLTSELSLINEFGISDEADGQNAEILNIATDSNNNIYILDRIWGIAPSQGVYSVKVYSASGIFQNKPITVDGGYYTSGDDYLFTQINNIAVGGNNIVLSTFSYANGMDNIALLKSYSLTGTFQNDIGSRTPGVDQFYSPLGMAFDNDGNILISESYKLYKFSISGLFIFATQINGNSSYFSYPIDLAVEPDGNILMADIGNEKMIERFTSTGQSLAKFGRGDGEGQFKRPRDAARDSHGNIYILDSENFRVQKFDPSGNFLLQFGSRGGEYGFLNPNKLEIDNNDNVYILDNPKIFKYDTDGNLILSFGNNVNEDGRYIYPIDMETDSENNLYVLTTDYQSISYVEKFNNNGQSVLKFGNPGQDDGQLSFSIYTLAVDNRGDIYINDFSQSSGGYRLQQFSNSGTFIKKLPVTDYLQDIEVDKYNNLYWSGYNSIYRITSSGTSYPIYTGGGENLFLNAGFHIDATTQTLIITDQSNNKVIKLSCSLPKPLFSVAPALAGLPTSFTDESTNIAPEATYLWDYGDGASSETKGNTQHIYEASNAYTATLTIDQVCLSSFSKTFNLRPTQSASNISFSDVTNKSMTITFKPGNGEKRVVLMAEESASLAPVAIMDGTELSGNSAFALATEYQTGWRVVYAGSDSTLEVTDLNGDVNYHVTVIEYSGDVTETQYLNDGAPVATQKTLPDVMAPTIAASNITFTAVSYSTMQVNFVKGNGEQRLVVMKEGSVPSFTPANDSFHTGLLENGDSVVYNGSGSSINLSDLLPGATYYIKIFEFNTDSTYTRYLIDGAPSASQRTVPDVLAPTVSASSMSFSSITPTSMKLNFSVGNGEQRLIIMKSGSQPSFIPADNAFYSGTVNVDETVMYNGSGTSLALSDLQPGTTYYLKVFEFNTDSTRTRYLTSTAHTGFQQTPQLPAVYLTIPTDGAVNQNANELKVAANKLDKVKTYTIELSTSSDFGSGVLSKSGVRNQTFSGLSYNTTYFARVKTDLSPFYGKVTSFTTAPPQYFAYVVSPADGAKDVSTSVTVSSNPLPEATSYTIELNTSSNFDGVSNVKTAASPNILFAGLNKRTTYYARVFTNLAQGLWGKSTSFTTGSLNKLNPVARDSENTEGAELTSEVFAVDILENPFKQRLTVTIKTPVEEEAALRLSDMTGKIIFQSSEKTNRAIEIDRPMVQGVYLIHVRTVSGTKIVRVVKVD